MAKTRRSLSLRSHSDAMKRCNGPELDTFAIGRKELRDQGEEKTTGCVYSWVEGGGQPWGILRRTSQQGQNYEGKG